MKNITLLASIVAIIISTISLVAPFYKDVAYVDINKILNGYERTAIVKKELESKTNTIKANVDSLLIDWQEELRMYEKERSSMTPKEVSLKQQLLQNKQEQLKNYQMAVEQKISEEDQKKTQEVVNDINDFVKEYGKEKDFKIIHGATGSGNIMYAEEVTDITDQVLVELNKEFRRK